MPLTPSELGQIFSAAKPDALRTFVDRARVEVPGARGESRSFLEDHLGAVVDELCACLASDGDAVELVASMRLGELHAVQRARGSSYTMDDLRREFVLLRVILFSFIPPERSMSTRAALVFGAAFDLCVSRSTEIFVHETADELLRTSNRQLALASAGGRVGFWHVDTVAGTFDPDEQMAKDWGLDLQNFSRRFADGLALVHPDDRHFVTEGMAAALDGTRPYSVECRVVHPSGAERWIHASGSFHDDANGARTLFSGISVDITDRKLGELASETAAAIVALERQNLEEVLEQTTVPTALLSGPEHMFTFANTAYLRVFGFGEDIVGRSIREVLPEIADAGFSQRLTNVLRTGTTFSGQEALYQHTLRDGSRLTLYVDFTYAAKRGSDGVVEGVLATIVDVTDRVILRKESERANALLEVEKFNLDQIIQTSPAAMATWAGPDLVFDRVNPEYQKIYPDRVLVGRPLLDVCPELRGQGFDDLMREVLATGVPFVGTEVLGKRASVAGGPPEDLYYDFKYVRINDENGRPYGVYAFAIDVTHRVLANRASALSTARLHDAERLLQRAIEVSKIGFYTWDVATSNISSNSQMQSDWGIEANTTVAEVMKYIHEDDRERVSASITKTFETGARHIEEYRVRRPTDGSVVWIEAQGEIIVDEVTRARRWYGTSLDITARKVGEEKLKMASIEAQNANVAKSAFLANMSHEIRTPLGAIMGFAELLTNPELTSSELLNYVAVIDRNSHHLLRVVDDILDLSKVEAGKMIFENVELSLPDLLSDFTSLMALRAREKGVELALRYESPVPDLAISDPTRLRQILSNVVGNAIKFTERGLVELCVRFDRTKLTFTVRDTGRGLTPEQAGRVFQAFVQADESTTRQFGGTGLGLVLTKRLANAMGGDFVLDHSELGKGSTFIASVTVGVPAYAKVAQPTLRDTTNDAARTLDKQRLLDMRVLVVDDSPDNRTLLGALLRKSGALVEFAVDGAEGVAMAMSKPFDAVLMDIQMPRLDGYQALAHLKAQGYTTPVVALTAHAMVEERARAEGKGFAAFITKPIRSEILLENLENLRRGPSRAPGDARTSKSKKVALLVDDDEDIRMLLGSIVGKHGFEVIGAADGAQALAVIASGRVPDLVLLDLTLPDILGADLMKTLRGDERLAATKIIVVSGWDNLAQKGRDLGADEALQKPIDLQRLKTILAEISEAR